MSERKYIKLLGVEYINQLLKERGTSYKYYKLLLKLKAKIAKKDFKLINKC